ncbi:hypothetical protein LCGC14_1078310 [marine sediment metagenome]|uniref:Uncharacterized protein n=1 Tax=marine sediment metagenome TaxID=412755 RepID=A0A0F9MG52_9ZZZZ
MRADRKAAHVRPEIRNTIDRVAGCAPTLICLPCLQTVLLEMDLGARSWTKTDHEWIDILVEHHVLPAPTREDVDDYMFANIDWDKLVDHLKASDARRRLDT